MIYVGLLTVDSILNEWNRRNGWITSQIHKHTSLIELQDGMIKKQEKMKSRKANYSDWKHKKLYKYHSEERRDAFSEERVRGKVGRERDGWQNHP